MTCLLLSFLGNLLRLSRALLGLCPCGSLGHLLHDFGPSLLRRGLLPHDLLLASGLHHLLLASARLGSLLLGCCRLLGGDLLHGSLLSSGELLGSSLLHLLDPGLLLHGDLVTASSTPPSLGTSHESSICRHLLESLVHQEGG